MPYIKDVLWDLFGVRANEHSEFAGERCIKIWQLMQALDHRDVISNVPKVRIIIVLIHV